ncbi:MAG: recombinase family protein [Pseudomonadota bacterium]
MTTVYYLRCSTRDQSVDSQRTALGVDASIDPDLVYLDEGVSGAIDALDRPGFSACARYCRKGDVLRVAALDRLGRNAIDVQRTFELLIGKGVIVDVLGMGVVAGEVGTLLVTILSGVAQMERSRIAQRTEAGRVTAREHLRLHGKTHRGKASLGRPVGIVGKSGNHRQVQPSEIVDWRMANQASITATAQHWGLSPATVKRYCANAAAVL